MRERLVRVLFGVVFGLIVAIAGEIRSIKSDLKQLKGLINETTGPHAIPKPDERAAGGKPEASPKLREGA